MVVVVVARSKGRDRLPLGERFRFDTDFHGIAGWETKGGLEWFTAICFFVLVFFFNIVLFLRVVRVDSLSGWVKNRTC